MMYATLNISATAIRLLAVKGSQVTTWAEAPLAPGLVRDGLILQPPAVGEAIHTLFQETRVPRERVITCLTGLPYTYRFLNLPRMKPALQEEAIRRAAKKEIPLSLEELYLFWEPVSTTKQEQDFFVVGVAHNIVDAMTQTLAAASIAPYLMDLKPLALVRAASRRDAIIASLETDCFDIILVVKGLPLVMYTASPRWEGATLQENARQLVDELLKTVSFYNNSHSEEPIVPGIPLLLTGALSAEPAAASLIQDESGYTVAPLVPQLQYPADLPVAAYAANIGLALKKTTLKTAAKGSDTVCHDINVNLLSRKQWKVKTRPVPMKRILSLLFLTLVMVLLVPLYQLTSQARVETMRLQTELSRVDQEIYQVELAMKQAEEVENAIREITASAQTIAGEHADILAQQGDYTSGLGWVTAALPPQTHFTSIAMERQQIDVQGETDNPFRIIDYALALEASGRFADIRITEIDERLVRIAEGAETTPPEGENYVITFAIAISK